MPYPKDTHFRVNDSPAGSLKELVALGPFTADLVRARVFREQRSEFHDRFTSARMDQANQAGAGRTKSRCEAKPPANRACRQNNSGRRPCILDTTPPGIA